MNERWRNLVVETQFATELVLSGIRRICELPMDEGRPDSVGYSETYPLNVGLHMYTSGLERLCKLVLACHCFLSSGTFGEVRSYSHRLSRLLDALESLDLTQVHLNHTEYALRPSDEYGDELVSWLERYSSGQGRYEILDSLTRADGDILTWEIWKRLCARGTVTDEVDKSISLRNAINQALVEVAIENNLESSADPFLESFSRPLSSGAVAVGLAMFRRARWAAEILSSVTNHTHVELPVLSEVVYVLTSASDDFFAYEVARISDAEVVAEELTEFFSSRTTDDEWGELDDE